MEPTLLNVFELKKVSAHFKPNSQAYRILQLLAAQKDWPTCKVNSICATGNVSDVVAKTLNPALAQHGLRIGCHRPAFPLKNQFGQVTQMHFWSLYRFDPAAANDPQA